MDDAIELIPQEYPKEAGVYMSHHVVMTHRVNDVVDTFANRVYIEPTSVRGDNLFPSVMSTANGNTQSLVPSSTDVPGQLI